METEIRQRLDAAFADATVNIEVDGNRAHIQVTSQQFVDLNRVRRQQLVYAALGDLIERGVLHAVTIDARPPTED